MRRVVVTGTGAVTPFGIGVPALVEGLRAGRSAIRRIDRFDPALHTSQIAGQVGRLPDTVEDAPEFASRDRLVQFAVLASLEAIRSADLGPGADPDRRGVCIANAIAGSLRLADDFAMASADGNGPLDETRLPIDVAQAATWGTASAAVADLLGWEGPCWSVPTGCTGGNDAIGIAVDLIRAGSADVVLAGAVEAPIAAFVVACFDQIGALSQRNSDPAGASRPFDRARDGFVLAEGGGVLVLEALDHARGRRASPLCEVTGFGTTCNAFHMTDLPDDGHALARSLELALEDASCPADRLDYVNAHGSSTQQNDVCETNAIKRVLGRHADTVAVSSIKSMLGHALAGANAIEAVACAACFRERFLPPTINLEDPDPRCDLDYIPNAAREARPRCMASLSSGFGGIHSTLVLERLP